MKKPLVKVLLIEDNEDDFVTVRDMLALIPESKFELDWVQTYEAAIAAITCNPDYHSDSDWHYDACLLDYNLGQYNGLELLQRAVAIGIQVPIVLLTGVCCRNVDLQAMENGATAFLSKDEITPASLERTIRYAIRQKQTVVSLQQSQQKLVQVKERLENKINNQSKKLNQTNSELEKVQARAEYLHKIQTRLLSSVAHEFRTPLTTIVGAAELLKMQPQADESKRLVRFQRIQNSVDRITRTLDNSLIYSSLEAGKMVYEPSAIVLNVFCEQLIANLRRFTDEQQQLKFVNLDNPFSTVYLDHNLLQLMLTHLLLNAICYAPKNGPIYLEVTGNDTRKNTAKVVFRVRDRGIGIPLAEQDKIFDAYYRASNANSVPGTPGVGLGLAVVKRAASLHGGAIAVKSEIGAGSTFILSLPFTNDQSPITNDQ